MNLANIIYIFDGVEYKHHLYSPPDLRPPHPHGSRACLVLSDVNDFKPPPPEFEPFFSPYKLIFTSSCNDAPLSYGKHILKRLGDSAFSQLTNAKCMSWGKWCIIQHFVNISDWVNIHGDILSIDIKPNQKYFHTITTFADGAQCFHHEIFSSSDYNLILDVFFKLTSHKITNFIYADERRTMATISNFFNTDTLL